MSITLAVYLFSSILRNSIQHNVHNEHISTTQFCTNSQWSSMIWMICLVCVIWLELEWFAWFFFGYFPLASINTLRMLNKLWSLAQNRMVLNFACFCDFFFSFIFSRSKVGNSQNFHSLETMLMEYLSVDIKTFIFSMLCKQFNPKSHSWILKTCQWFCNWINNTNCSLLSINQTMEFDKFINILWKKFERAKHFR